MKCQHGEIMSKFCISANCTSKIAGGCPYCLKRNHFHLGLVETLSLDEVQGLFETLKLKESKKRTSNSLKELINNYFQGLKTQLGKSLDTMCNSMIDRVSHSYLFHFGLLETYKKIEAKDYKKISSEDMRLLYQTNLENKQGKLQKNQEKFYNEQLLKIRSTIEQVKKVFDSYQREVGSFDKHFSADSFFYKRIIELIDKITVSQSVTEFKRQRIKSQISSLNPLFHHFNQKRPQSNNFKQQNEEMTHQTETKYEVTERGKKSDSPLKIRVTQKIKNYQQKDILNRSFQPPQQPKLLSLAEYRNQKTKSSSQIQSKNQINFQLLNVKKHKQRKLSINMDHLSPSEKSPSSDGNSTTNKSAVSIQIKSPIYKLEQIYKKDVHKLNLKNYNYNVEEDNTQAQFRIRIKYPQNSQKGNQKNDGSFHNLSCKQCNSQIFSQVKNNNEEPQNENNIKTPCFFNQHFKHFDHEEVKKKVVKFDVYNMTKENQNQIKSPTLRNKFATTTLDQALELKKVKSAENKQEKPTFIRKMSAQDAIPDEILHQDEVKSSVLLLESLKLTPDQAVQYLRKSFEYCPLNLSTAEYLSYLLIQQNHPKQCLELCNYLLNQIKNAQNFNFSVHILNNKAAALNLLGRFSECIQFAQKMVGLIEKDTLYKNLGDAYCSLGIIEKSILNYQKCISLNHLHDEAFYNLAVCFYTQHHYSEALQMVSEAIRLNSEKDQYIELYRNTKTKVF